MGKAFLFSLGAGGQQGLKGCSKYNDEIRRNMVDGCKSLKELETKLFIGVSYVVGIGKSYIDWEPKSFSVLVEKLEAHKPMIHLGLDSQILKHLSMLLRQ